MTEPDPLEYERILDYVSDSLGISSEVSDNGIDVLRENSSGDFSFKPDAVLEDFNTIYLIEINPKATLDTIAWLNLLRDIWSENEDLKKNIRTVFAAKSFPEREKKILQQLDITMLKLPWSFKTSSQRSLRSGTHRITSEKSWKIVSRLLKEKRTSIRQLSLLEDVSYGWAHKTVQALVGQNIIKQDYGSVSISNTDKLLNGVAWERPLENLKVDEISISFSGSMSAAKEITQAFAMQDNLAIGFTSYTAAALYTGYGVRHDTVYLYLKDEHIDYFRELFETSSEGSIKAMIYRPDREVFKGTREKEGVRIVSPSQTLLDLAGMGYSAMDITKDMVSKYDRL